MKTLTPPYWYYDQEIYEREQRELFRRVWYFVGLTTDLSNPQDWIKVDIGGVSVVIQNFEGKLKALHNVCSHRFAEIRQTAKGNGILQCPYHGWIYGEDGCPSAIPSRPRFEGLDEDKLRSLSLKKYQLANCGLFLFVKVDDSEDITLADYLGEKFAMLELVSTALGEECRVQETVFNGNWKLTVENTLEAYHVDFIHPLTLGQNRTRDVTLTMQGRHSTLNEAVVPDSWKADKFGRLLSKIQEKRVLQWSDYVHQHIFPNVMVVSLQGKSFHIQQAIPLSAGRCLFRTRTFQTQFTEVSKYDLSFANVWIRSSVDFIEQILEEDRGVVESSHRGVQESGKQGILSDEELRVGHFQKICLEYMQASKNGLTQTV